MSTQTEFPVSPVLRWSAEQVLALAPDLSAQRSARGLAGGKPWLESGVSRAGDLPPTVWGLCQGSGATPYQTAVDLTEPAFKCDCPSRKLPCKHALALLLRWSAGALADEAAAPGWVHEWHIARAERAARSAGRSQPEADGAPAGRALTKAPSEKAQARRNERVAGGLEELDRWLADQARAGLAGVAKNGYAYWDTMAARLVDAQAASAARTMKRMAALTGSPERLLGELAQLRLLVTGFRRIDELPDDLAASVRLRIGFPVGTEAVLAGGATRDHWQVLGVSDEIEDGLTVRRTWLHGAQTGRRVIMLTFAVAGQPIAADLLVGTRLYADICCYPGGQPPRGLIAERHGPLQPIDEREHLGAASIPDSLQAHAAALAVDPWLERWPMVLDAVVPVRSPGAGRSDAQPAGRPGPVRWHVADAEGVGLPVDPAAGDPWRLVGVCGGHPVTVAGEWSAGGFRPLSAWAEGRLVPL
jgi:hypothetical protein